MKAHWMALAVGVAIGAALGWWMAGQGGVQDSKNPLRVTGTQNAPFQRNLSRS